MKNHERHVPLARRSIALPLSIALRLSIALLAALPAQALEPGYAGSAACAKCHQAIAGRYSGSAMARSSGRATPDTGEGFEHAAFTAPGYQYEVSRAGEGLRFSFTGAEGKPGGAKALPYFVGSGAAARSYLIADAGYLFEAPVAYYANGARWDLAPRYEEYSYPFLTRPAIAGCLGCHASFLALEPGSANRYAEPPFGESGVACERCHGPGAAHAAGRGGIVNPGKLDAERRDSVCAQCHLSGEVRVRAAGADWNSYKPGDKLADTIRVFVRGGPGAAMTVTGHAEKLAGSACLKASGGKLWCGSCHDAHAATPVVARERCLSCHKTRECAAASAGGDCASCHMPKAAVRDARHVAYTDHSIPRRPRVNAPPAPKGADLAPFGGGPASIRDLALAYAITGDQTRAFPLLQRAVRASPRDVEAVTYLAEIHRDRNEADRAIPLYKRALAADAANITASAGLGAIMMEQGNHAEAVRLWEDAVARNAGLLLVRVNLAMAYLRKGDKTAAERHLRRALELSPAFAPAAELLKTLRSPG